jgi:hypothetical protein
MALSNYTELKSAIDDWAMRGGSSDTQIVDAIALAEAVFNYGEADVSPIRTRDMETSASLVAASDAASFPDDFLELIKVVSAADAAHVLKYVTPLEYDSYFPSGQSTNASFYTVRGSTLICPDDTSIFYYAKIEALATSPVNWLLTKHPGVYLHGGLYKLYTFMQEPSKAGAHRTLMASTIASMQTADVFSVAGNFERSSSMMVF